MSNRLPADYVVNNPEHRAKAERIWGFAEGTIPAAFKLAGSKVSPSGVIVANYERNGEVKTGSFDP